jgi:transitional endoplasmic reticulum ATPase
MPEEKKKKPELMPEEKKKPELKYTSVELERKGKMIILPEAMSLDEGIIWLGRMREEEEAVVRVFEEIDAYPLDAALAVSKALQRIYGWANLTATPGKMGIFGKSPDVPPTMVGMEVAPGKTMQVPWGRFQIPSVEGWLEPSVVKKEGRVIFAMHGEIKKKHKPDIQKIIDLARVIVLEESVYKGQAIRMGFELDEDGNPTSDPPKFIDTSKVREEELVFSTRVAEQLRTNLFTPIERTAECRAYRIPLKRGVLLEGPYGTGKTLTAHVAAKKCVSNGWTFIYLSDVKKLSNAIMFAKQYQPAVIFAEDLDQALEGERDDEMNAILNTIDGVDTKGSEIIVALTTNHLAHINAAMLRPGRLDAIISIQAPDAQAVQNLIRLYARGLLRDGENLDVVGDILHGQIPAVIREVVERAKLAAIARKAPGDELDLQAADLASAGHTMLAHAKLLEVEPEDDRKPLEMMGDAMGKHMAAAIGQVITKFGKEAVAHATPTATERNGKESHVEA